MRPWDGSREGLPRSWWLPGAFGSIATIEASGEGLRVFQGSRFGMLLFYVACVAYAVVVPLLVYTVILLVVGGLGMSSGSLALGFLLGALLVLGITALITPYVRGLVACRLQGPFVPLEVVSAAFGRIHHELHMEGDGEDVWVRITARPGTLAAALRLAHQLPLDAQARAQSS